METVSNYYHNVEFPDSIYIALDHCLTFGKGSVVNIIEDLESALDFIPIARIDQLVLNIPQKEEFYQYFSEKYKVTNPENITPQMEEEFWNNYRWRFASEVGGIKIIWE
ncbi:hypothetical protein [Calderihabitans maritimus]|nr:hypothetical protein [Calderihabitans maritimus]